MKKWKTLGVALLALSFGFVATNFFAQLTKSDRDEAKAQPAAMVSPGSLSSLTAFRAVQGLATSPGEALLVTNLTTKEVSINFYFQCVPGVSLGTLGTCPDDGIAVSSKIVCEGETDKGKQTCN